MNNLIKIRGLNTLFLNRGTFNSFKGEAISIRIDFSITFFQHNLQKLTYNLILK